ncbi:MAG: precorrin-6y C5,15-methyltransferase (decarboxylating) subunit CbiE [Peptostreptococcaceae bacterium]|nr:precorrin-6y C5,15-methyltransferase (decarboxylating) subunit CbiE [Peptostreptococcaceae bacterium]
MANKVTIVGVGLGQERFLTAEARDILTSADKVYTTARIGMGLENILKEIISFKVSEIVPMIKESSEDVVVMVSGDTGFYSLAKTISRGLRGTDIEIVIINGISSMQYFFAKLGSGFEDVVLSSAHGRSTNLVALATYNKRVFALTGGEAKVKDICRELHVAGMDHLKITVGEDLGSDSEKIYCGSPVDIMEREISELAVILIENEAAADPNSFIRDEDLERGNAPMTKEEIRHVSLAKLNIQPDDIVYDIGAGTGSVTLEMAKRANRSWVYAVEQKEDAYELVKLNQKRLGIYNIRLSFAKAPEGMQDWEPADKVFIGGSGKNMGKIIDEIVAIHRKKYEQLADKSRYSKKSIRFVINTITLESLTEANQLLEQEPFENVEYVSISSARSKKIGGYNMMMANNPIYIISADYMLDFEG